MRFSCCVLLCVCSWAAERKLPPQFEPLAQAALGAPPEFASDALLRLVESRKVEDRATAIDLVQQAFDLAGGAHFRVAMQALPGAVADTRENSLAKAYALKLDALSLQSRAALAMLPFDGARAREMLRAIVKPELAPLTCDDSLVYSTSEYYRALAAIVAGGFSAKERGREDHVSYLLDFVSQARTAAQLSGIAGVLKSVGLSSEQLQAVTARLNGQLESVSADDRSFSASLDQLSQAITPEMSASFSKYVDRHLGNKRCEENVKVTAKFGGAEGAKTEGGAKFNRYWQTDAAQRLMDAARKLRFGSGAPKVLSDADRSAAEWRERLTDFEKDLAGWDGSSEKSESDYYQEKCMIYQALVELIPAGPERDKTLNSFTSFVVNSRLYSSSPAEWFVPVREMLVRVRNTNNGEPAKVLTSYEASGNPALIVYTLLERTFERSLPSWVPGS